MPEFFTSIPGTFEDSPESIAEQLEDFQLDEQPQTMDASIEGLALGQLKNHDQSDLLDAIDELRAQGISKHIDLPQLIVCGDQSSGKSSLLEAITQLPFPTKDGICTTFATEVALRRSSRREVKITIIPGPSRSDADKERLRRFHASFTNAADFPALIDDAKRCMNPGGHGDAGAERSINDDVLHIDISGPSWAPLTIVDLPGLIQSESRGQTAEDVRTVKALVRRYMANPRSVVLAVVAAHYDFANQGILRLAREADRDGTRTLGIITKPDRLNEGTQEERGVVRLAKNLEHPLALGWHVVKNRDHRMEGCSSEERDRAEREFFERGIWSSIVKPHVGVDALRRRLAAILLQQIRKELPVLVQEIEKGVAECEAQLERLGEPREQAKEQKAYLVGISKAFERLTLEAVQGTYQHSFFTEPSEEESHDRRLRAVVQNSNEEFAYVMQKYGHRYTVSDGETVEVEPEVRRASLGSSASYASSSLENAAPKPKVVSRYEYLQEIQEMVRNRRGRELPGTYNPLLICDVFRKQAEPWAGIAKAHADVVWQAARGFLETLLGTLTEGHTYLALLEEHIQPIMDERRKDLFSKIDELLKPYKNGHLITYHPLFVASIEQIRKNRALDCVLEKFSKWHGTLPVETTLEELTNVIESADEEAHDQYASFELLYCMEAYYKVALHIFVDNVATLAVESCLVSCLPEIFSPTVVSDMPDEILSSLASESEDTKAERQRLQDRLKSLKDGHRIVRRQERQGPQPEAPTRFSEDYGRSQTVFPPVQPFEELFVSKKQEEEKEEEEEKKEEEKEKEEEEEKKEEKEKEEEEEKEKEEEKAAGAGCPVAALSAGLANFHISDARRR
ncbi:hypothetical protein SLS57_003557 [Botryosphaeria dothidea]